MQSALRKNSTALPPSSCQPPEKRSGDVSRTPIFAYYETDHPNPDDPAVAHVRFTQYGQRGKPLRVRQLSFADTPQGVIAMEEAVEDALNHGHDAYVVSHYDLDSFPVLAAIGDD